MAKIQTTVFVWRALCQAHQKDIREIANSIISENDITTSSTTYGIYADGSIHPIIDVEISWYTDNRDSYNVNQSQDNWQKIYLILDGQST